MPKEPVTPPRPQPAEPEKPPVTDPQPYKDPIEPPPRDPQEDQPMRDPVEPDSDRPPAGGPEGRSADARPGRAGFGPATVLKGRALCRAVPPFLFSPGNDPK